MTPLFKYFMLLALTSAAVGWFGDQMRAHIDGAKVARQHQQVEEIGGEF